MGNQIARLLVVVVVVVVIILTTPQTTYIHTYIQLIQTTNSPTMEKKKNSRLKSLIPYLATYASSSF